LFLGGGMAVNRDSERIPPRFCSSSVLRMLRGSSTIMKDGNMNDKRFVIRTVCKRDVTFLIGERTYHGAIENMSNYGASILAKTPGCVQKGETIRLAISCDDKEDNRDASVVWSEGGSFGAKFI